MTNEIEIRAASAKARAAWDFAGKVAERLERITRLASHVEGAIALNKIDVMHAAERELDILLAVTILGDPLTAQIDQEDPFDGRID
jgi:hypothetical protein